MRVVTFRDGSIQRPGVVSGDGVIDLSDDVASVLELIGSGGGALEAARRRSIDGAARPWEDVELTAPIPVPRRDVWAVGWNYLEHFEEGSKKRGSGGQDLPEHPAFFVKASTSVIGPHDTIAYDPVLSEEMDYEAELAVVIGRQGRSIPEAEALEHVFGYTIANDVTARDIQRRHGGQWIKGKSIDGTCPTGPWIVTADEIVDPQSLRIECRVNGEVVQSETTSAMAFPVATLIAELSLGTTLLPGDMILTGTPKGVGYARDPQLWLRPGDEIAIEVDGIGRLVNRVSQQSLATYAPS